MTDPAAPTNAAAPTNPAEPSELGYAAAIDELEEILAELDDDDLDVDVLASRVERAAELIALCRGRIRDAQLKVERVVADLSAVGDQPLALDGASDADDDTDTTLFEAR
jgi:exodeoxyribonuclease VII small subunit